MLPSTVSVRRAIMILLSLLLELALAQLRSLDTKPRAGLAVPHLSEVTSAKPMQGECSIEWTNGSA